jgi:hypothetical protein
MITHTLHPITKYLILTAVFALPACDDQSALAPDHEPSVQEITFEQIALARGDTREEREAVETVREVTERYMDINNAIHDEFVLLHPCEERPGEGTVGAVYVKLSLLDGRVEIHRPEALIYEPAKRDRPAKLVGVEYAIPYTEWTEATPPTLLGHEFQREDEFGVWALHFWAYRFNPDGLFAEANSRVQCN